MIDWKKAVSGKVGQELAQRLTEAGIVDLDSMLKNQNVAQKIELDVFRPVAMSLIVAGAGKADPTGVVAWSKVRGYSTDFEDSMYANGIYTVQQAQDQLTHVARLIALSKGADRQSLKNYARNQPSVVESEPIREEKEINNE